RYQHMRHSVMLGFCFAFWAIPDMTVGHLLFSVATTGYILVALQLEEHDLLDAFGERYQKYCEQVPMLIPWPGHKSVVNVEEKNTEPASYNREDSNIHMSK